MSDERAATPGPRRGGKPMAGSPGMIAWKGARLQIAAELLGHMFGAEGVTWERARRTALEQAEQLLLDNEEMP